MRRFRCGFYVLIVERGHCSPEDKGETERGRKRRASSADPLMA